MGANGNTGADSLAALLRAVTLLGSDIAFAGLFAYLIYVTWDATPGNPPAVTGPVVGAAAALAVVLAAAFAGELGSAAGGGLGINPFKPGTWKSLTTTTSILFAGIFLYMAVGAACGLTYLANADETPSILKTVAVAFGGYVIAYLGAAYKQLTA